MRMEKEFDVARPRAEAAQLLAEDAVLAELFPDTKTDIVARKGSRKTIESHYTALSERTSDALVGLAVLQVAAGDKVQFVLTSDVEAVRGKFAATTLTPMRVADLAEVIKTQFDGLALLRPFAEA